MKKGKICTLFLLFAFLMTGCTTDSTRLDSEKFTTITVWHYYNGKQKEAFDTLLDKFNQTEGLKKKIIVTSESKGDIVNLEENIIAAAKKKPGAEKLPDIFATYADTAVLMYQMDLLADISNYMTEEEISQYNPFFIREGKLNDGLQILPVAKATELLYLNKTDWDIFAKDEGYTLSNLSTWEGISEVAEAYYKWSKGKTFFGRDAAANFMLVGFHQLGKDVFIEAEDKVILNIDEDALKKVWDTYCEPYIRGYYGAFGRFRSDDLKTGDIIAAVASTSSVIYYPKEVTLNNGTTYPIDVIVLPLPDFCGAKKSIVQQGAGMAIIKSNMQKEKSAAEFLKWFTNEEQNIKFCVDTGYFPVKTDDSIVESMKETLNSMEVPVESLVYNNVILGLEAILNSDLYVPVPFKEGNIKRSIITKYFTEMLENYKINYDSIDKETADSFLRSCYEEWSIKFKKELEN